MKDQSKTKQVLIQDLAILRQRVEELEQSESEWKKEKEELKKSESLFSNYFDLPLHGVAITSPEKGWIKVNDRICSIMGYSRDEIVCKTWSEMTHPDDLAANDELFSRVLSGKIDQYNMDKRFIRKDGEVIWSNISVGCVRKSDGSVDHMVCVVEDITSARLAGEALRQERILYEDLITTQPAGVYRLRVKLSSNWQAEPWSSIVKSMCSVDMASDRYCEILGISHANAGLVRDLIHPDDKQDFDVLNMEALTRLSPFTWEGRIIRDHQTRWIHFESLPRMLDSETILWTGIVYDITDHKQVAEALRESEERLRLANKATNDVVWDWDVIHDTQQWNESGKVVFGWTDIVERPQPAHWWVGRVHPEDLQRVSDGFFAVVNNPEADYWQDEYRFKKADGSYAQVMDRGHVLRDDQGKALRMIGAMLDITDRKREEAEKQSLQERLRLAEKMEALGQLAGGVAHDLNNVLSVTSIYCELLQDNIPEGSPLRKSVDSILVSTQKAADIIQDMLILARRGVVVSEVVNLNAIISNFLKTPVFEKIKSFHPLVTYKIEFDKNLLNSKGSPIHLEKTIMNLISNASEAISGEGEVTIRTENRYIDKPIQGYNGVKEGDYAVLTVSDSGMGIPAESMGQIFEPFYTKKTMGRSGTGLGLSIVWGTVKDHNGYIDVQSEVAQGTTFTLYFPVTREELTTQQKKMPIEQYMGKGDSVLVVDDIAEQRGIASTLLTRLGYQVHAVAGGDEAVEYLKEHKADILVLDMIMTPGIDGLETYRRVLEINPNQRAILVSGFAETDRVKEAQKMGAGVYVKKPYTMEGIGVALRDELARK